MLTRTLIKTIPEITTINVNPGLSATNLGREFKFNISFKTIYLISWFILNARNPKNAARNLTSAAAYKGGSQDYWTECVPFPSENIYLYSGKGFKAIEIFNKEMIEEVEKISPGSTAELI
nr:uncharacterized protein I206_00849 [Kwoniella pini CBS 10737]OCF53544.1 hypothetical protein I206_00849 [Kwoniella pini CBS 10737]